MELFHLLPWEPSKENEHIRNDFVQINVSLVMATQHKIDCVHYCLCRILPQMPPQNIIRSHILFYAIPLSLILIWSTTHESWATITAHSPRYQNPHHLYGVYEMKKTTHNMNVCVCMWLLERGRNSNFQLSIVYLGGGVVFCGWLPPNMEWIAHIWDICLYSESKR